MEQVRVTLIIQVHGSPGHPCHIYYAFPQCYTFASLLPIFSFLFLLHCTITTFLPLFHFLFTSIYLIPSLHFSSYRPLSSNEEGVNVILAVSGCLIVNQSNRKHIEYVT